MSNWKKYPNLFANGKFRVYVPYEKCDFDLIGFEELINTTDYLLQPDLGWTPIEHCQLIARPISDMTDEEIFEIYPKDGWEGYEDEAKKTIKHVLTQWSGDVKVFLYLLSIGVYPFDDETDVIFKPKTEQP